MRKISKYRQKLFFNFFLLFIGFAVSISVFQYNREKKHRVESLEQELITYIHLSNKYIINYKLIESNKLKQLDTLKLILPNKNIRLTVIDKVGTVIYDSFVKNFEILENHKSRPEVVESFKNEIGTSIRNSKSTSRDFFYCSIYFDGYYIRAAVPYDIEVKNLLRVDAFFMDVIFLIFIVASVTLIFLSDKLGSTITKLQYFAEKAAAGKIIDVNEKFPNNELGEIGNQIVSVYNDLRQAKNELATEREKLFRHLQISHEGIAVFTKDKKNLLANNHFIQYLNALSTDLAVSPNMVFNIEELNPVIDFINDQLVKVDSGFETSALSSNMFTVNKNNKYFVIHAIVFGDLSFEISINDVTKVEKEKKLKQQMTSNIAHELKTPVSSILGYLETLKDTKVDKDTRKFFIERSYAQSQRLASLIQDISLLNKIEEASNLFSIEEINVRNVVNEATEDLQLLMEQKEIKVEINIPPKLNFKGNKSVFFSIWRNLIENAINYAGNAVTIRIKNYLDDENFLYFSFSDNGTGIPEQHLTRIFERFYRIDSGRSRAMGGTGLGLAIVKNGVIFHKGEISVKNLKGGGLEFIFSICKDLNAC